MRKPTNYLSGGYYRPYEPIRLHSIKQQQSHRGPYHFAHRAFCLLLYQHQRKLRGPIIEERRWLCIQLVGHCVCGRVCLRRLGTCAQSSRGGGTGVMNVVLEYVHQHRIPGTTAVVFLMYRNMFGFMWYVLQ